MKNQTPVAEKAFKQISFNRDFVNEVTLLANAADRSAAKHIEHCVRVAQAVEQILPSRAIQGLKAGELPAAELLAGLAAVLANPGQSIALRGIMDANPVRVSQAPGEPDVFIRTNADGSKDRGTLDDNGGFAPGPVPNLGLKGPKHNVTRQDAEHKSSKTSSGQPVARRRTQKVPAHA